MTAPSRFARVGRRRAALEAALLAFVLALPLATILRPALELGFLHAPYAAETWRWPVLGIGMVYIGFIDALVGAIRLRRTSSDARHPLRDELIGMATLIPAIWLGAALAHGLGALWVVTREPTDRAQEMLFVFRAPFFAAVSASAAGLVYPFGRGLVLAWPIWDGLRRTRLLWALTHAQLVGSLVLVVGVAALLSIAFGANRFGPPFGPEVLPPDAGLAAYILAWVNTRLLPTVTGLLLVGAFTSAILLPPAVLISFLALRSTTRRLETLADATEALRAGDLATRVPVEGKDEVGKLQADFNAMAADLEQSLRDLQAERDRVTGLLEARRQLVASVSHELRTPVATIRGYLESALRREEPDAAALGPTNEPGLKGDLDTMAREVERLQRLIEDLFALSRAEVGRLELRREPTDVAGLVRRLVETTAPLAWQQRRVQVLADVSSDVPPAQADAERLEQVVSNLIGNAVRHTPPGGLVAAVASAAPDTVRVEVRDTGEGIAPEELTHVFERFYRGSSAEPRDGAGLGLALVKELTEAMGGSVEVDSTPGEGSRFTVVLPRA
jgi:signal transduction histidine kinase